MSSTSAHWSDLTGCPMKRHGLVLDSFLSLTRVKLPGLFMSQTPCDVSCDWHFAFDKKTNCQGRQIKSLHCYGPLLLVTRKRRTPLACRQSGFQATTNRSKMFPRPPSIATLTSPVFITLHCTAGSAAVLAIWSQDAGIV
ncbi:hypothetical protein BaRGS_00021651 [Batillaria attramentaria]|uniref:Uncharacterized protein n=1 Tax=Batillaria attramentaria TaxID=370345 RepID=A0ABD0KJ86_9CAEN